MPLDYQSHFYFCSKSLLSGYLLLLYMYTFFLKLLLLLVYTSKKIYNTVITNKK